MTRRNSLGMFAALFVLPLAWVAVTWSLEYWGGTFCTKDWTYVSREDVFAVGIGDHLSHNENDGSSWTMFYKNMNDAKYFRQTHPNCCELHRQMSILLPSQYWRSFFFPFRRHVFIKLGIYGDNVDDIAKAGNSSPHDACYINLIVKKSKERI